MIKNYFEGLKFKNVILHQAAILKGAFKYLRGSFTTVLRTSENMKGNSGFEIQIIWLFFKKLFLERSINFIVRNMNIETMI